MDLYLYKLILLLSRLAKKKKSLFYLQALKWSSVVTWDSSASLNEGFCMIGTFGLRQILIPLPFWVGTGTLTPAHILAALHWELYKYKTGQKDEGKGEVFLAFFSDSCSENLMVVFPAPLLTHKSIVPLMVTTLQLLHSYSDERTTWFQWILNPAPFTFAAPRVGSVAKGHPLTAAPHAGQQSCSCFAQARAQHQQKEIVFKHPAGLYFSVPGAMSVAHGVQGLCWMESTL